MSHELHLLKTRNWEGRGSWRTSNTRGFRITCIICILLLLSSTRCKAQIYEDRNSNQHHMPPLLYDAIGIYMQIQVHNNPSLIDLNSALLAVVVCLPSQGDGPSFRSARGHEVSILSARQHLSRDEQSPYLCLQIPFHLWRSKPALPPP
jgi:hypothetical protein